MEWWSGGVMEYWSDGVVEWWSIGVVPESAPEELLVDALSEINSIRFLYDQAVSPRAKVSLVLQRLN